MAIQRSRRLRKKLHIDEFQEIGFNVRWNFAEGTDLEVIDTKVDLFLDQLIEPNGLAFAGSGYLNWEGLVCLQNYGTCTEQHRTLVAEWLQKNGMQSVTTSGLFDIWWDDEPE